MKYIYLYSWVGLAYLFIFINKVASPVVYLLVSALKINKENQEIRRKKFYKDFLTSDGGMIDRGALALTLILVFSLLGILIVMFDLTNLFFNPPWVFGVLLVIFAGLSYYVIYFRSSKWLTPRIKKFIQKLYPESSL